MKILFINNWELDNPLTVSTTFPAIEVLSGSPKIEQIVLVTPEYEEKYSDIQVPNIVHAPVHLNRCTWPSLLRYVCWEVEYRKVLTELVGKYSFDRIIARGAPAGGRAWWLSEKTGLPFYVESFEPHADYMYESGVWGRFDPRYLIQKYWEKGAIRNAAGLMPVAENYKRMLLMQGAKEENVHTVPCTVDMDQFGYSSDDRQRIRKRLGISLTAVTGIYVGKFGDIYYDKEAFEAFETAFEYIPDFHLILLSSTSKEHIAQRLKEHPGIDRQRVHHTLVKPDEVATYLSAADFAYELHRANPSTQHCSPIKVGEYWANGLPVIISKGVGDDAGIIEEKKIGAIFDPEYTGVLDEILHLIKTDHKEAIMAVAREKRSRSLIAQGYKKFGMIS